MKTRSLCYLLAQLCAVVLSPELSTCNIIERNSLSITPQCRANTVVQCTNPSEGSRRTSKFHGANSDAVEWIYKNTTLPNFLSDFTNEEVQETMRKFYPLFATECSRYLRLFVCSVATPLCTPIGIVPPCRELCDRVQKDCQDAISVFDVPWPKQLSCNIFPKQQIGDSKRQSTKLEVVFDEEMSFISISEDEQFLIQRAASMTWVEALAANGQVWKRLMTK